MCHSNWDFFSLMFSLKCWCRRLRFWIFKKSFIETSVWPQGQKKLYCVHMQTVPSFWNMKNHTFPHFAINCFYVLFLYLLFDWLNFQQALTVTFGILEVQTVATTKQVFTTSDSQSLNSIIRYNLHQTNPSHSHLIQA